MSNANPFKWRHARGGAHSALRALVPALRAQLSRPGGNDAGTGTAGGPHDDLPLGSALCSRAGQTLSGSSRQRATTPGEWMKRTSTARNVDVPLSSGRLKETPWSFS